MTIAIYIAEVRERLSKATPGPWGPYKANIPFNAIVTKPAASLSKHDSERTDFWRYEDAELLASAPTDLNLLADCLEICVKALGDMSQMIGFSEIMRLHSKETLAQLEALMPKDEPIQKDTADSLLREFVKRFYDGSSGSLYPDVRQILERAKKILWEDR